MDEELLLTIKRAERFRLRQRGTGLVNSKSVPPLVILPPDEHRSISYASEAAAAADATTLAPPPPQPQPQHPAIKETPLRASSIEHMESIIDRTTVPSSPEIPPAKKSSLGTSIDQHVEDSIVESFNVEFDEEEVTTSTQLSRHRELQAIETDLSIPASQSQEEHDIDVDMSTSTAQPQEELDADIDMSEESFPPQEQRDVGTEMAEPFPPPQEQRDVEINLSTAPLQPQRDGDIDMDMSTPPPQLQEHKEADTSRSAELPQLKEHKETVPGRLAEPSQPQEQNNADIAMSPTHTQLQEQQEIQITMSTPPLQPQPKDIITGAQPKQSPSPRKKSSQSNPSPQQSATKEPEQPSSPLDETVPMDITATSHLSMDLDDFEFDGDYENSRSKEATPAPPPSEGLENSEAMGSKEPTPALQENEDEFVFDFEGNESISQGTPVTRGRSEVTSVHAVKRKRGKRLTVFEEDLLRQLLEDASEDEHGEITVDAMRENVTKVVNATDVLKRISNPKGKSAELTVNMAMNYLRLCVLDTNVQEPATQDAIEILLSNIDTQLKRQLELYNQIFMSERKLKRVRLLKYRAVNRMREAREKHQDLRMSIAHSRKALGTSQNERSLYSDLTDLFDAFDIAKE